MNEVQEKVIAPQPGFQTAFLSSPADVVIGGGSAYGGKTFALLMDAARGVMSENGKPRYPGYGAVIFRKSIPEIKMTGGLWDEAGKMYPHIGGKPNETERSFYFEDSDSSIVFKQIAHERDLPANKGQFAYIGYDELTDFSKKIFIYMLSRNRTSCGMKPKIRATCNPDPDHWLASFLEWWIDQDTGFAIPERSGVIRYFTVDEDNFIWGATREEVYLKTKHIFDRPEFAGYDLKYLIKSATFIPGSWTDNQIGIKANPGYMANLNAQSEEEKLRLRDGNWKIRVDQSSLYDWDRLEDMFSNVLPTVPSDEYFMSIDHASTGQDLCIIGTWKGWKGLRIDIIPQTSEGKWRFDIIVAVIKMLRMKFIPLPVTNMMVDQDGIGIRDTFRCNIFQGHTPPTERIQPPPDRRQNYDDLTIPKSFKNKKAQCAYKLAQKVNGALMSLDMSNIFIWNDKGTSEPSNGIIKIKGKTYDLRRMIKDQFRAVRREKIDFEGRKEITPKDKQKNANDGLSPDIYDMALIRAEFDFIPKRRFMS